MPPSAPEADGTAAPATTRWAFAGFVLAAAAGVLCAAAVARGGPILAVGWSALPRLGTWSAAWGLGVACALRLPARSTVPAVFAAAVLVRLAALSGPPVLSDDLYRYAWDGRVQAAGINPYRYAPSAPELTPLRERWLWPDAGGCEQLRRPPGCTRINRPTVRTIYPPAAQLWFAAVYRVAGIDVRHKAWQVVGLMGDLALVGLLPWVLAAWGRDRRWMALYALSPVPVVEVVNNGHVDGLAGVLVVLALLFAARRSPGWAGALVGAAALVKLYPALVLMALSGAGRRRSTALIGASTAAVAVAALGYLPHVVSVGTRVLGYLPGYLREEKYDEGGRYLLAGLLGLPAGGTAALAAGGLFAVAAWVLLRRPDGPRAAAALLGALLLAATPVQPWYAVVLLAAATVAAAPAWSALALAGYPYFFAVILDAPARNAIGRASYGLAFAAIATAAWVAHRRPVRPRDSPTEKDHREPPEAQ